MRTTQQYQQDRRTHRRAGPRPVLGVKRHTTRISPTAFDTMQDRRESRTVPAPAGRNHWHVITSHHLDRAGNQPHPVPGPSSYSHKCHRSTIKPHHQQRPQMTSSTAAMSKAPPGVTASIASYIDEPRDSHAQISFNQKSQRVRGGGSLSAAVSPRRRRYTAPQQPQNNHDEREPRYSRLIAVPPSLTHPFVSACAFISDTLPSAHVPASMTPISTTDPFRRSSRTPSVHPSVSTIEHQNPRQSKAVEHEGMTHPLHSYSTAALNKSR